MRYAPIVTAVLLQITACHEAPEARPQGGLASPSVDAWAVASAANPAVPRQTPTVRKRMQNHFEKTLDLKDIIERGDLEAAKSSARWLASTDWTPHLRPDWQPYFTSMQRAAAAARDANDLPTAAGAFSRVCRTCANCHEDKGGPKATSEPLPRPSPESLTPNAHAWAADRMWEGLIAPSSTIWIQGADVLASAVLHRSEETADAAAKTSALEDKVHALARVALAADAQQRTAIYAELLVTCSSCHAAAGIVLH